MFEKNRVIDAVSAPERPAPFLEVGDEMAMPDNPQAVDLLKTDRYPGHRFQVSAGLAGIARGTLAGDWMMRL